MDAPEEIVLPLQLSRSLEARNLTAHGVDPAEDFLDGSVLARCVASLKDDQQREPAIRVENFLQLLDTLDLLVGGVFQFPAAGQPGRRRGVGVAQTNLTGTGNRPQLRVGRHGANLKPETAIEQSRTLTTMEAPPKKESQ